MRGPREAGISVVSMLASVVIVLVLGSIVLSQTIGGNPAAPHGAVTRPGGTTAVSALASAPPAAVHAACVADVAAIESAVAAYETVHGGLPPAGTAWATAAGGPLAGQHWPSGDGSFTLAWTGTSVGVRPLRGPHAHQTVAGAAGCAGL